MGNFPGQPTASGDAQSFYTAKRALQSWLEEVGKLAAKRDPELLKTVELIKKLEAMFSPSPGEEDRRAA